MNLRKPTWAGFASSAAIVGSVEEVSQLAERGHHVVIHEMRPVRATGSPGSRIRSS